MSGDAIAGFVVIAIVIAMIAFGIAIWQYQKKTNAKTQRDISDRDLLRLIASQPDQLLSPHQMRDKTGMTLNQCRTRLSALFSYGILYKSSNSRGRSFFGFHVPLIERESLDLSEDPFLTVEDLLQIFEVYDYRVTPQDLIMATGLPLSVIKREMKHFEKEGILQRLSTMRQQGMTMMRFFVLQEPYRSDPEQFRRRAGVLDLEMREILRNDNLIV